MLLILQWNADKPLWLSLLIIAISLGSIIYIIKKDNGPAARSCILLAAAFIFGGIFFIAQATGAADALIWILSILIIVFLFSFFISAFIATYKTKLTPGPKRRVLTAAFIAFMAYLAFMVVLVAILAVART